jgi:hypothetical protein
MPEPPKDTWIKLVVLSIIGLALAAGVAAFKSTGYTTQVQIYAAREARLWQDYQVESVKKDNFAINRDILATLKVAEGKAIKGQKTATARIKEYEDEMSRLNQEKDQIKKEAQKLAAQGEVLVKKAGELGLGLILFQLAIMSSAAGVLARKKILWLVGLGLGVWGLVYLGLGLML